MEYGGAASAGGRVHLLPVRRILVSSDLGPGSHAAVERAARLSGELGADLAGLYVLPPGADAREREEAHLALETEYPLVPPSSWHFVEGRAFVEIIRASREVDADLVVLGALDEAAVRTFFLGGTAERVLRKGDRPVLVVKGAPRGPYRRVLVASDLSETSARAARMAKLLAPHADMELLHVTEDPREMRLIRTGAPEDEVVRAREEAVRNAREALRAFREENGLTNARITVESGRPAAAIPEMALRRGVDLIAIGTHGRTGLSHMLLGSVAESTLRDALCDTLAVRPESFRFVPP